MLLMLLTMMATNHTVEKALPEFGHAKQ